ncbi:MAG TPA: hypothetical protein VM307_01015 [Egibacteraceae bacterium]|nr:hypothetical protein [Egibacteraceae bacterium]
MDKTVTIPVWLGIAFFVVFGLWAFAHPPSFYELVATFPPYNAHFLRDVGAFMLGLGMCLAAALRWSDAMLVALAGTATAAVAHLASHVIDGAHGPGGITTGGLVLVALLLVMAATARAKGATR